LRVWRVVAAQDDFQQIRLIVVSEEDLKEAARQSWQQGNQSKKKVPGTFSVRNNRRSARLRKLK
jgi:hypothetical protein